MDELLALAVTSKHHFIIYTCLKAASVHTFMGRRSMDRRQAPGKLVGVHENTSTRLADASHRAESARIPEKVSNIYTGERFDGGLLA